jgi:hypothetical protein
MVVKMVVRPIAKLSKDARSGPSRTRLNPLPGLSPDPNHRHRPKRSATTCARIAEAQPEGWLGEVEGLQINPRRRRRQADTATPLRYEPNR